MKFINVGLISHPANWLTLTIWVFVIGFISVLTGVVPMMGSGKNPNGLNKMSGT